ncbi:hypothetical protein EsH8_X_000755 [Colletotrichum jinshuiense]
MSELLDYIVYMTYNLHSQWDAGIEWASPGYLTEHCLRSHINRIEMLGALAVMTQAVVPSNKVLVGVRIYSSSFQMADSSRTSPNCPYTGDRTTSYAQKGRCTHTGGYIANAEIDEIGGDTNTQLYKRYNMGGTIDWAVDLIKLHQPPEYGVDDGNIAGTPSWAIPAAKLPHELIKASESRAEVSFDAISSDLIDKWKFQTDKHNRNLLRGNMESVAILTSLFLDGKIIIGKADDSNWKHSNYTESCFVSRHLTKPTVGPKKNH